MSTFGDPLHIAWNVAMTLLVVVALRDFVLRRHWSDNRERWWSLAFVLGPSGSVGGLAMPVGVLAWLAWYRWRETAGYHPHGKASAEVEDGADDLAGLHGGDGVLDAVEGPHV